MTGQKFSAVVTAIGVATLATAGLSRAQEPELNLEHDLVQRLVTWTDVDGEVAYRITGGVGYLLPPSCIRMGPEPSEGFEIEEELSADTTEFRIPPPQDARLTWLKDIQITVEAIDASGKRIALDGFAFTGDHFCTEEQIAAELGAAGTGPSTGASPWWLPAALAGLGALAVAGSLALRRKAA